MCDKKLNRITCSPNSHNKFSFFVHKFLHLTLQLTCNVYEKECSCDFEQEFYNTYEVLVINAALTSIPTNKSHLNTLDADTFCIWLRTRDGTIRQLP